MLYFESREKITVIEGGKPLFEEVNAAWANSVIDAPFGRSVWLATMKTFNNARELESRFYRAREEGSCIRLYFPNDMGIEVSLPILAVSSDIESEPQLFSVWVTEDELSDMQEW